MADLDRAALMVAVTRALAEDLAEGEPEEAAGHPEAETGRGLIVCRRAGILAGVPVAREAFARVGVRLRPLVGEGTRARAGEAVAEVGGSIRAMLAARPTAIALLERLSAIASRAREPDPDDPLDAYAASFARPPVVSSDNGPRFDLELEP